MNDGWFNYPCSSVDPSAEEERVKFLAYRQCPTQELRDWIVASYLRYVIAIARRYRCERLTWEDRVQEGVIGLLHAADKFEVERGLRFTTYAANWIKQSISRAVLTQSSLLPARVGIEGKILRASRFAEHFKATIGRTPTTEEIEQATGLPLPLIELALKRQQIISLQDSVMAGTELERDYADPEALDPYEAVETIACRQSVLQALRQLSSTEQAVICYRFGLFDYPAVSLRETGERLSLSGEGARQIQVRACRKLKKILLLHDYTG